ncbi:MAG TPA: adenosine kinase, partial [Polyangiaceae bacterium]|nr:adenosine kinase [Polyangiaceae bacterium]
KVGDDELGRVFADTLRQLEIVFPTAPSQSGTPTARCVVLVSADAQRTMCTYLGACVELGPEDIDIELIQSSKITYLEGYLWDPPRAKEAFLVAARAAHAAKRRVSLSLSDSFCVGRHRDSFLDFVRNHVDVLFANDSELMSLYQTDDIRVAINVAKDQCPLIAVTRGAFGCTVAANGTVIDVPAKPVARVVDTTGAGDLFAAGFLHGLATDLSVTACARVGGIAAAEVISHVGARPELDLAELVRRVLQ